MTRKGPYGNRVTVMGAGRSGLAAARLLRDAGLEVFVSDFKTIDKETKRALRQLGAETEQNGHSERCLDADYVIVSPGVPSKAPILQDARHAGIGVYSEIELGYWYCDAPIVAVTGTNGKTSTTALIGHMFVCADRPVIVAGNIGIPFAGIVKEATPDHTVVLEVSSFQLDHIDCFRPNVALLLNVTQDHLDRYDSFDDYANAKLRITKNQTTSDTLIYGFDCKTTRQLVEATYRQSGPEILPFSTETTLPRGAYLRDNNVILRLNSSEEILMQTEQVAFQGLHNVRNALAASVAARVLDIRGDVLRESLTTFQGVPHRMEVVRDLDGVRYVNDSKATNVNSVWFALESYRQPVVLIAGGRDKGNDYSSLKTLVDQKVRAVIGIGESGESLLESVTGEETPGYRAFTMKEAVELARQVAHAGDVVLLSPACSSFDMFDDFEDRGETFTRLVNEL